MGGHVPPGTARMIAEAVAAQPVRIPMNLGKSTIVDAIDADLAALKWFCRGVGDYAYRRMVRDGRARAVYLHREIATRMGLEIQGREVDHINGDGLDNRRANLRVADRSLNTRNSGVRKTSKSGYRGVHLHKPTGTWHAQITLYGKTHSLRYHATPEAANEARLAAERELWGIEPRRAEAHA